ncbi:hypothetical protein HK104_002594 [Borealophlyctis nickersoniae]|nr:hypothetical protein HK104_002594 [Borealophlyctis nickersoniae]
MTTRAKVAAAAAAAAARAAMGSPGKQPELETDTHFMSAVGDLTNGNVSTADEDVSPTGSGRGARQKRKTSRNSGGLATGGTGGTGETGDTGARTQLRGTVAKRQEAEISRNESSTPPLLVGRVDSADGAGGAGSAGSSAGPVRPAKRLQVKNACGYVCKFFPETKSRIDLGFSLKLEVPKQPHVLGKKKTVPIFVRESPYDEHPETLPLHHVIPSDITNPTEIQYHRLQSPIDPSTLTPMDKSLLLEALARLPVMNGTNMGDMSEWGKLELLSRLCADVLEPQANAKPVREEGECALGNASQAASDIAAAAAKVSRLPWEDGGAIPNPGVLSVTAPILEGTNGTFPGSSATISTAPATIAAGNLGDRADWEAGFNFYTPTHSSPSGILNPHTYPTPFRYVPAPEALKSGAATVTPKLAVPNPCCANVDDANADPAKKSGAVGRDGMVIKVSGQVQPWVPEGKEVRVVLEVVALGTERVKKDVHIRLVFEKNCETKGMFVE